MARDPRRNGPARRVMSLGEASGVRVRRLVAEDAGALDRIADIERAAFPQPWGRAAWAQELAKPWAYVDVAQCDGSIVGFSNYWCVADEVQLLAIAASVGQRRRGIGSALLRHLFAVAVANQAERVTLEVRRSNAPAIALYRAHGFVELAIRRDYYATRDNGEARREDAVVMVWERAGRGSKLE